MIWALIILALSIMPSEQLPTVRGLWAPDKWAHALVYGLLAYGIWRALLKTGSTYPAYRTSALLAGFYGILIEVVQYAFFPGRYFELLDIVANIIGILGALMICKLFFAKY